MLISSYFTTFPGGRPGGRPDAGYIKIKANLSPVELNWGLAELVKKNKRNKKIKLEERANEVSRRKPSGISAALLFE